MNSKVPAGVGVRAVERFPGAGPREDGRGQPRVYGVGAPARRRTVRRRRTGRNDVRRRHRGGHGHRRRGYTVRALHQQNLGQCHVFSLFFFFFFTSSSIFFEQTRFPGNPFSIIGALYYSHNFVFFFFFEISHLG